MNLLNLIRYSAISAACLTTYVSSPAYSVDCFECQTLTSQIQGQSSYQLRINEILEKNKNFLFSHSTAEDSIRIKITSNIFVAKLRLETTENKIAIIQQTMAKKECPKCQVPKNAIIMESLNGK